MRCTHPRTVGFKADGKTICWSQKQRSKEFAPFQLPCGKCLECRLEYGRQWAVRSVHEAEMYGDNNAFITLTYSPENLKSSKLIYEDFQLFVKRLREEIYCSAVNADYGPKFWENLKSKDRKAFRAENKYENTRIGVFCAGEYGEETRRPHWHALLFNWRPSDGVYSYTNKNGDDCYESETLTRLWGKGHAEFGSVTFKSAGYVARYAAKKIVHSPNGKLREADTHEWQPISKKSSKHAIGKRWLEKNWPDVFNRGELVLKDGSLTSIPRYYEKWLQKHNPERWIRYVTQVKAKKCAAAQEKTIAAIRAVANANYERSILAARTGVFRGGVTTPVEARTAILKAKFKMLQEGLKL